MHAIQLVTDCEGPLALNDNAFELCRDFIKPDGDRFFKQVSRFDDCLTDIFKKPGYKAGDTLKLILPFLKAYGLNNARMGEYAEKTVKLMPDADQAYFLLHSQDFPIFEISTSYRQFAEVVGTRLGFPKDRIFCTELDLDRYGLSPAEADRLKTLKEEIVAAPAIDIPPQASRPEELPPAVREALDQLERIFWEIIPGMDIGRIYEEVDPIGGPEKAKVLSDSLAETGLSLANTIYVGDSITDVQAFEAVRAGGGAAISFNGNHYAVNAAEIIVVADNAWPVALLAAIFLRWEKDGVLELATSSRAGHAKIVALPEAVAEPIVMGLQGRNFSLYHAAGADKEKVAQESLAMRARLRGEAIAALG